MRAGHGAAAFVNHAADKEIFQCFAGALDARDRGTGGAQCINCRLNNGSITGRDHERAQRRVSDGDNAGNGTNGGHHHVGRMHRFDLIPVAFVREFLNGALRKRGALVDDGDAVGQHFHFAEKVAVHQYGATFAAQTQEHVANFAAAHGVNTVGWFVKDHQLRVIDERRSDTDPLLHAL